LGIRDDMLSKESWFDEKEVKLYREPAYALDWRNLIL